MPFKGIFCPWHRSGPNCANVCSHVQGRGLGLAVRVGHEVPIIRDLRNSAGAVASAYETNNEPVSVIIGPTGGGKTESSVRRILRIARSQHPSPKDGVRKCRIVCVGNTYRDLWDKAIPSYLKVFNKSYGEWQGGKGDPASHTMDFIMYEPDGRGGTVAVPLHIEVWFRAKSGEQSLEDFVRGLETTCWWLQEMDQLDEAILSLTSNRCGRYPEPDDRWEPEQVAAFGWEPAFIGVWGDTNMPVVDSWLYNKAFKDKEFGAGLFVQPPAILKNGLPNLRAENLHNLRKIPIPERYSSYYDWLADQMDDYDVTRLLKLGKAHDRRGQPVHLDYDEDRHEITGLQVDPRAPLIIACDTGNTLKHAAVFIQPTPHGGANALDEISPKDRQCNLEQFAAEIVAKVKLRFPRIRDILIVCDPAAQAKMTVQGAGQDKQITYAQYLGALTGIETERAPTNDPGLRRTSLSSYLKKEPGILIDAERCPDLVAAMGGGYCFRKIGNVVSPQINKNDYSHLGEAFEYGTLKLNGASIFFGAGANSAPEENGDYDQQPEVSSGY